MISWFENIHHIIVYTRKKFKMHYFHTCPLTFLTIILKNASSKMNILLCDVFNR